VPAEENGQNQTRDHSFDELAKGLANRSLSRRDAFKWLGAAIMGGLLVSIPGVGWAHHKAGHTGGPPSEIPPSGSQGCPSPKIRQKGQCVCPATTCTSPEVLDPESCRCGCYIASEDRYSNCNMATEVKCCPGYGCVDPAVHLCCGTTVCVIGSTRCCSDGVCRPIDAPCTT